VRIISLVLTLLFITACADPGFEEADGTVVPLDGGGGGADQAIFPDAPPLPDGYTVPPSLLMYAHSREELFAISPGSLKLKVLGKLSFDKGIPDNEKSVNDIAMTSDGRLFAITKTFIYEVNFKTVKATKVTQVQGATKLPPMVALTFEKSGKLLGSNIDGSLYRIYYKSGTGKPQGTVEKLGEYGSGMGSSGDLVAIKDGSIFGVTHKGSGATKDNNKMIKVRLPGGSVNKNSLALAGCPLGHGKVWGLAYWAGTIYGFTRGDNKDAKMISIKPNGGDVTKTCTVKEIKTYPYQFWGAAVTPLAPLK